jgi:hypothetical protein
MVKAAIFFTPRSFGQQHQQGLVIASKLDGHVEADTVEHLPRRFTRSNRTWLS